MLEKDKKISYSILEFIKNLVQGPDNFLIFLKLLYAELFKLKIRIKIT